MSDGEAGWAVDPDYDPEPDAAGGIRARKAGAGSSVGNLYAKTVAGELKLAHSRMFVTPLDEIIKVTLFLLYAISTLFTIMFFVPMMFDYVVSALFFFIVPFVLAVFSGGLFIVSFIDSFNLGLFYKTKDANGKEIVISYRDRMFNMAVSGAALGVHILVGTAWAIWYGFNYNLNKNADYLTFSRGVVQYYSLLPFSGLLFLALPLFACVMTYAMTKYKLGVHLADVVSVRVKNRNLADLLQMNDA